MNFSFQRVQNPLKISMYSQQAHIQKRKARRLSFTKTPNLLIQTKEVSYSPPPPPPEKENKKTLVLDLDETLVHLSTFLDQTHVKFIKVGSPPFIVCLRPGLENFLHYALINFDVFVFTYGKKAYADSILDVILPTLDQNHRLYRDSCQMKDGYIFKDLDILKRNPEEVIFIDDNVAAQHFQLQNTLHIPSWLGTSKDNYLLGWLIPILEECLRAKDVREVISKVRKQERQNRMKTFLF